MKYEEWEALLVIYQHEELHKRRIERDKCKKTITNKLLKKGWLREDIDGCLYVTEIGKEAAKEYAPLYEIDLRQIGQTY